MQKVCKWYTGPYHPLCGNNTNELVIIIIIIIIM
jgi:hypothetical protein